jgi:hypothetical protein
MVDAWSHDNQLALGRVKVDEKSNEITALPSLLKNLDITGSIITTDALDTQNKSAELIVIADIAAWRLMTTSFGWLFIRP